MKDVKRGINKVLDTQRVAVSVEDLSGKTGVNTSELVQAAIQLVKNNTTLEGFDD